MSSPLPSEDDFLDHKISDILKGLAAGDDPASLYAAQHGGNYAEGIPPEVFVLVGVGPTAQILCEVFQEIAVRYGLEFRNEL